MARLYTNENFPQPAAEELRRLGHDILTVQEAGNAGKRVSLRAAGGAEPTTGILEIAEQRCCNRKIVNVLDALPKKLQSDAREQLCRIPYAAT